MSQLSPSLNVSTKPFALISAALLLLDFASTSVVSAATAASYLAGEVHLPFHPFVPAVLVLVLFTIISLTGIKESARIALVVLLFHVSLFTARRWTKILISTQPILFLALRISLLLCSHSC